MPETGKSVLGPQADGYKGLKTLILDLDGVIISKSMNKVDNPFCTIASDAGTIYVQIRPGVENFLKVMAPYYELVIFTRNFNLLTYHDKLSALDRENYV